MTPISSQLPRLTIAAITAIFIFLSCANAQTKNPTQETLQSEFDEALETSYLQSRQNEKLQIEVAEKQKRLTEMKMSLDQREEIIKKLQERLIVVEAELASKTADNAGNGHSSSTKRTNMSTLIWSGILVLGMLVIVSGGLFAGRQGIIRKHTSDSRPIEIIFLGLRLSYPTALALLYLPTGLVRGMMISLLPLQALDLLGSAQKVSVMYLLTGVAGIAIVLTLPRLSRRFGSRRVFDFGFICTLVGMLFLLIESKVAFFLGLLLHILGIASFEVALMLFLMSSLRRDEYKFFEPYRVVCAAMGFIIGPVTSIYLKENFSEALPFVLTMTFAALGWGYSRYLNLGDVGPSSSGASGNPVAYIMRFFSQPRLALSYTLSLGRYAWWAMFYIYVPIYTTSTELGATVGGMLVSAGTAATWLAPLWGKLGRQIGLRQLFLVCFLATGITSTLAFATAGLPTICAVMILLSAIAAAISDGASHIPFYRATRARERAEMSGVYATHRDTGQLLPPGVFSLLLKFLPLPVVFAAGAGLMFAMVPLCRYLPRRM